ncbi:MAG: hypothetical protein K0S68_804 [Candidatus Saccharibacteria bacterium]|jgi:hypothetical protein|nr:hypothetical protein [Candidatus Saccharibacteria bacterium]
MTPRNAELVVEILGEEEGLSLLHEIDGFVTGLTGKCKREIRPDYFVVEEDLYIEVTTGKTSRKRHKIACATGRARLDNRDVVILLFDLELITKLNQRLLTLREAIAQTERIEPKELDLAA